MERSGGMVTGSHERNELVRVRHGSDSRVGVSGFVSTLLLHRTSNEVYFFLFFFFGCGSFVQSLSFYACNGNESLLSRVYVSFTTENYFYRYH